MHKEVTDIDDRSDLRHYKAGVSSVPHFLALFGCTQNNLPECKQKKVMLYLLRLATLVYFVTNALPFLPAS